MSRPARGPLQRGRRSWRGRAVILIASGILAVLVAPGQAHAQFGGFFMPVGPNVPSPVEQVNAASRQAGAAAFAARQHTHAPYRGNPNSHIDIGRQIRQAEASQGISHFNIQTRRPTPEYLLGRSRISSFARAPEPQPTVPVAAAVTPNHAASTVVALAQFFDAGNVLVWPGDAPVSGDLGSRRADSDAASLAVLREVQSHGSAEIETAADARARLLDYGRPALQYMRDNRPPAVAENFHAFMLSLYDALGQSTLTPPQAP